MPLFYSHLAKILVGWIVQLLRVKIYDCDFRRLHILIYGLNYFIILLRYYDMGYSYLKDYIKSKGVMIVPLYLITNHTMSKKWELLPY